MKKVLYKGKEYSMKELMEILKLSYVTLRKYIEEANGKELEEVIERKINRYVYAGTTYRTLLDLSNATGINRTTLKKLIETNLDKTIDEIVLQHKSKQKGYTYKGNTYKNINEVANALGIDNQIISRYLRLADHNLEKAMELYEDEHTYAIIDGVRFRTQKELADFLEVNVNTLIKYINEEGSITDAVQKIQSKKETYYTWRGKKYLSLNSLSRDMGISRITLKRIMENETNGDVDKAYILYQKRNNSKYKVYTIKGKKYSSKRKVLKELEISSRVYYNRCNEYDDNFEKTVEAILTEREKKEEKENIKKQIEIERKESQREYIYNGEKIYTIAELSRKSGISETSLRRILGEKRKGNVDEIIQNYLDGKIVYTYDGEIFDSVKSLAEYTGINELRLGRYIRKYDRDAEKAIFMIKSRDLKMKKIDYKGKKIPISDLSIILGIKSNELIAYLNQNIEIEEIENLLSNTKTNKKDQKRVNKSARIMYDDKTSLHQYCIKNKINYSCIYYAITMGKTPEEALDNYYANGQRIPSRWIYEKYDILLKHLLLNEGIDSKAVVSEMRNKIISLNEALTNYIVRDEAKKSGNIPEWQIELYYILTSEHIPEEEKEDFKKYFFVSDSEMESVIKAKERVSTIERKILLYEIAECIKDETFSENEMIEVLKAYEITGQEIETIFLDLYCNFYEGVRLAEGEKLLQERKKLNNYIRNYDNMSKEDKIRLEHNRPQYFNFIKKVSFQIAFYKNAIKVKSLFGQDVGKIGYSANVKECQGGEKIIDSIIKNEKGVDMGEDK